MTVFSQQPDAYDQAIEYLRSTDFAPAFIEKTWGGMEDEPGGVLFKMIRDSAGRCQYGCLTQIRDGVNYGKTFDRFDPIVRQIAADSELPSSTVEITPESLPRFAAWQRAVDQKFGHEPPTLRDDIPLPQWHYTVSLNDEPPSLWRRLLNWISS